MGRTFFMSIQLEMFNLKLRKLVCSNCDAPLDMNVIDGTTMVFCPYCGQKLFIDDEKTEYTINRNINKNINNNKTVHTRYTDDAEILKIKLKYVSEYRRQIITVVACVLAVLLITIPIMIGIENEKQAEREAIVAGKISVGYYDDFIGKNYKAVKAHFESAGFTNIELVNLKDSGLAFWKNNEVVSISIGGNSKFTSSDYFYVDTKVVISYH